MLLNCEVLELNLSLESYFQGIRTLVRDCAIVQSSNLVYEVRSRDRGFWHGDLQLTDGSLLYVREFVKITSGVIRDINGTEIRSIRLTAWLSEDREVVSSEETAWVGV